MENFETGCRPLESGFEALIGSAYRCKYGRELVWPSLEDVENYVASQD